MAATNSGSLFAVTFGNLRQYIKEHQPQQLMGGLAAGALRLAPAPAATEETDDNKVTPLVDPTQAGKAQPSQELPEAQAKAPLTIFYEEQVYVFDDVPAGNAMKLLQLAGSRLTTQKPAANPPSEDLTGLPIKRKASLQRLLHKRQYRTPANHPHQRMIEEKQNVNFMAMKDVPSASWLQL